MGIAAVLTLCSRWTNIEETTRGGCDGLVAGIETALHMAIEAAMILALRWFNDGEVLSTDPVVVHVFVLRGTRVVGTALEGRDSLVAGVDAALHIAMEAAMIPVL